jgi:hypothetical protein
METQALTDILQDLVNAQFVLLYLTKWLSALVAVLALITVGGGVALFLELRMMRQMLVAIQSSAERIAEMVHDLQRRVP